MQFSIEGISEGQPIPSKFALGKPDPNTHVTFSDNLNPKFSWSEAPEGTKSFALICKDVDVPTKPDDVNQEGKTVPFDLPRADFYHLVLVDIPADCTRIAEGALSTEVTARGKSCGAASVGVQGKNDYTGWFAGDAAMEGVYGGYDGPCPPWNDERVHRYTFTVYALSVESLQLEGEFEGSAAVQKLSPHVLDSAAVQATYAIYAKAHL